MADNTGLQFTVSVGDLPAGTFAVVDFTLQESLNTPFELTLNLASLQPGIDFSGVLDHSCELLIWHDGKLQRRVSGVVSRFEQGNTGFRRTCYSAVVRPAIWRSTLRTNARIFQARKPDVIIAELLSEAGITDHAFALRNDHAEREYCVQYRESDMAFINRIAAEEGMYWFHEYEAGVHRVVFADDAGASGRGEPLFFNPGGQGLAHGAFVRHFKYAEAVSTSAVELKDYSFKTPAYGLSHRKASGELENQRDQYEHYDYPGRFKQDGSGKAFSSFRLDALRAGAVTGSGEGNCAALRPGLRFMLCEHPNPALNISWQVVSVKHTGTQPQALEEEGGGEPTTFSNAFEVIKASTTWRQKMPGKPMVDGPQIATVTGPSGEEIYCDSFGRVKLQFPWDRYGASDDQSSCWVRVSQGWAGGQYGMMAVPRIGHEVVVSFLEGDPDQPIITGRTFHAANPTPYLLPANKTRTVLRSRTHKGEGFNEISLEDEAGHEEIYVHSQKDMNIDITHNSTQVIGNNHTVHTKGSTHITTDREYRLLASSDISLNTATDMHVKTDSSVFTESGTEIHLKAGSKLVLEAGSEITIQAAGHFIKIDASGVTSSSMIDMGSGSPGQGSGWKGQLPETIAMQKAALLDNVPPQVAAAVQAVESVVTEMKPLCLSCMMDAAMSGQTLLIRK